MGKIYKNGIEYGGGGGSGTGGHTIVDTDGNPVADEPKLQFTGLDVQDNSTDSETEVSAFGLNTDSLADIVDSASATTNPMVTNGLVYSTTEQVVGKWIDGKPLYQKTYSFSNVAINANTEFVMAPYDSSIDKIICGFLNTPYKDTINPVYITNNSTNGIVSYVALPSKTTGSLWSHCNSFTIQYTKTTD